MNIEIKAVDPGSIPAAKGGNENKKWRDVVVAFIDSDAEAVEVMGEANSRRASTGLRAAVAGLGQLGRIKVVRRGERTFLVKVDESASR